MTIQALLKDFTKKKTKLVEEKTNELIQQFQEELLQKQNSVIEKLKSSESSLLDQFNSNPSLELAENLMFDLTSEVKLIFDVEIISPNDIQNIDKLEITDRKISEALYIG